MSSDQNTKVLKGLTVTQNGTLTPSEIEIIPGGTASTKTSVQGSQTVDRTLTLPDATDTLVGKNTTDVLTNKSLSDSTTAVVDVADPTKQIKFDASGTTGTSTTLTSSQTSNKTLTLPDATDTLVGKATTDTLTNKTIDANGTGNSISNLEVADLAAGVLNTSTTLTGASDLQVPSALAVKTYVDTGLAGQNEASEITYSNATSGLVATNVQAAIDEVEGRVDTVETGLANHLADAVDAHDASAISNVPSGNLAATDVQSALNELQSDIDTRALASDLTTHTSASTGVHGITGSVVGTTDSQVLSNKYLDDGTTFFVDSIDQTKQIRFNAAGTTGSATILTGSQTINRIITFPDATTTVVGTDATQALTNKDVDGGTASNSNRITIPKNTKANLDALTRKEATIVYATDQSKAYIDDGSNLQEIGSGGGSINFIENPDGSLGIAGWTEGSYTAATRPSGSFTASSGSSHFEIDTTVLNPLGTGTTSFRLIKTAGVNEQGRAIETSFALPLSYRAKVLQIEVDYIIAAGTFVAGSSTTDSSLIWYCAFSNDNGSTYTVAEPSSFKMLSNSTTVSDVFRASIQSPYDATHMKLIAYVAETATTSWEVVAITSVSPSDYVYGSPITDPVAYTATLSTTGSPTNYTVNASYRKTGSKVGITARIDFTGDPGATYTISGISLPIAASNDSTIYHGTKLYGIGKIEVARAGNVFHGMVGIVNGDTSGRLYLLRQQGGAGGDPVDLAGISQAFPSATDFVNGDYITIEAEYYAQGLSSSVQQSDGYDGREISLTMGCGTQSIPTGIYTPLGFTVKISPDTVNGWTDGAGYNSTLGTWTTNPSYTIKSSGKYRFGYNITWAQTAWAAGTVIDSAVKVNGTSVLAAASSTETTSTIYKNVGTSGVLNLNAGDVITIVAYHNYGSNKSTIGTNYATTFSIEKLSGSPTISASETVACIYETSAAQSIPTGTSFTTVLYNTKVKDTHGAYDTSNGRFTAPYSGTYLIAPTALYASASFTAGNLCRLALINSSGTEIHRFKTASIEVTATPFVDLNGTPTLVDLDAGSYVTIGTNHGEATARLLTSSATQNRLSIYKVK